jgi:hypothetical protein
LLDEAATALPDDISVEIRCDEGDRQSLAHPWGHEIVISAPEGVTFRHEVDAFGRTHATFYRNGKVVGSADVRDFDYSIQITNFQIRRGARRKGIGTAFQLYIEAHLGKRSVPDAMLSKAEYRRWKKIDPVAVQDYVKGTKSYTPRRGSNAYVAAQGGLPVPGSRAAQSFPVRPASVTNEEAPIKSRGRRGGRPSRHEATPPKVSKKKRPGRGEPPGPDHLASRQAVNS